MKISELIKLLEEHKEQLGDVEVYTLDCGYESDVQEVKEGWYNGVCVVID